MTSTLQMLVRDADGALVRVLGLSERRGYRTLGVRAEADPEQSWLQLLLCVEAKRPVEQLVRQLNKLVDVRDVEVCHDNV